MSHQSDDLINRLTSDLEPIKVIQFGLKELIKVVFVGLICVFAAVIISGIRTDIREVVITKQFIFHTATLIILCLISILTAFSLSIPSQDIQPFYRRPIFYIVIYILSLLSLFLTTSDPFLYLGHGFTCFIEILSISILPAALLFYFIRRAAALRRDFLGVMVLLSGVSFGLLGVQLTCTDESLIHLFFWHLFPSFLIMGTGIFIARKVFAKI